MVISCVLQDSRFEVSKNGTLRINNVEVYDGTWYRCVSSTPAGSIEAQARVQVLGELTCRGRAPCLVGRRVNGEGAAGFTVFRLASSLFSCLSSSSFHPPILPLLKQKSSSSHHHPGHSSAWSLTRRPQCPAQPQAEKSPLLSGYEQVGIM